ncbi:MAG: 30S ribosomal protein S8e [Candidatus Aenigmarchaeota archaeon]|nr:30S ribosomal protein S8e [Candidatus Aenigmarchaeota archaeon]
MTKWLHRSKRTKTGSLRKRLKKNKRYQLGRDYLPAHIGEKRIKVKRAKGGNEKRIALKINTANIIVKGKAQKTKILKVLENKANPHFVRMNIITKGAVIETELGKAVVSSRPGQEGVVNARLLEEKS